MPSESTPLATYRLQFNSAFTFAEARGLVSYLSRLGISHVYSSPILRSRSGSTHGYDVVDPQAVNPELGGETALREFITTLQAHGMGVVLDIVPNHMAASGENPYWQDVLTFGLGSPYARWFDIDWRMADPELWGRVVVPVLGDRLPIIIAKEEMGVAWADGRFMVRYYQHAFPIDPTTLPDVLLWNIDALQQRLETGHPALQELVDIARQLRALPRRATPARRRAELPHDEIRALLSRLAQVVESSPIIHEWVNQTCEAFPRGSDGHRRMRRLLGGQSYRLVHWRRAATILNYRRFFDINDLISLRQEDPEVFNETHALILRWVQDGLLDGLRIDHLDGLRDPLGYLQRLADMTGGADHGKRRIPIYVEKILAPGEKLPDAWPIAGTTGYEFISQFEPLLISPDGFTEIERRYRKLLRMPVRFRQLAQWGKHRVLRNELSAFVGRLADILYRLAQYDPNQSELTHRELVEAIVEVTVCLGVYRTYIDGRSATLDPQDRASIEEAVAKARHRQRAADEAIDFLAEVLLLDNFADLPENEQQERLRFVERFQQLTGPAAAKGVEDTALYAYVPLVSLNDVGGEPELPHDAEPAARLHAANAERAARWPRNMLGVTTHDTKRTADVRARLDVLSEIPKLWAGYVKRWREWHRPLRRTVEGHRAPDAVAEYLIYQTLIGIWPAPAPRRPEEAVPESEFPTADEIHSLRERVEQYMLKAVREAKTRTSWVDPHQDYEEALVEFLRKLIAPEEDGPSRFLKDVNQFVARIARPGFWNSLSRTLIQLTAPGLPDIYQGDELWNFALVDPDNRRPVDYELRRTLLDEIVMRFETPEEDRRAFLRELVSTPKDGRIKLHLIRWALHTRREHPDLFVQGGYEPLEPTGERSRHLFAYARTDDTRAAIIIAPRLIATLLDDPAAAPIGGIWGDTTIPLPPPLQNRRWRSLLTGDTLSPDIGNTALAAAEVLNVFPVALLVSE